MSQFSGGLAWIQARVSWGMLALRVFPLLHLDSSPSATDPNIVAIQTFFTNLTTDLTFFALAMAAFFFALSAIFYMAAGATGNERTRTHAISSLYAALAGLAFALLAGAIAALVNEAFPGVGKGDGPAVFPSPTGMTHWSTVFL
ncbi:MAG: hypothetical protein ACRDHZ_24465 [Ktedonobacteraceae bacterium]